MILIETSVLIQFLRGENNTQVALFEKLIQEGQPFGISSFTYAEVLQGARDEEEYQLLDEYLGTQTLYEPHPGRETYREAASIVFRMRKKGFTVRGLVDVLIALTAIQNDLLLLHNDKDFEFIKTVENKLMTLSDVSHA